jgi:hypothetical protein
LITGGSEFCFGRLRSQSGVITWVPDFAGRRAVKNYSGSKRALNAHTPVNKVLEMYLKELDQATFENTSSRLVITRLFLKNAKVGICRTSTFSGMNKQKTYD